MFKVENIFKVYSRSKFVKTKAINGISFTLEERWLTFILGKSGSGKSTLLNPLSTLYIFILIIMVIS